MQQRGGRGGGKEGELQMLDRAPKNAWQAWQKLTRPQQNQQGSWSRTCCNVPVSSGVTLLALAIPGFTETRRQSLLVELAAPNYQFDRPNNYEYRWTSVYPCIWFYFLDEKRWHRKAVVFGFPTQLLGAVSHPVGPPLGGIKPEAVW